MNKKQLTYFLTACRTKNIQTAADELYISHQGLSRVLRALEEELGQSLFTRSNRGLEPTDFALTLIPHVQRLLADYDRIEGIRTLAAQNKSVVSIVSLDHILHYLGTDFIEAFNSSYPDITLSVVDGTDANAWNALEGNMCDFALVNGQGDSVKFYSDELFYSRYCLRMRKDHPLAEKENLCIKDLQGEKMIGKGRAYDCFRNNIEKLVLAAGVDIDIPVETSDEELIMELVERKGWLAVTYDFSAVKHCGKNTIIRYMEGEEYGHAIYLARHNGSEMSKAAEIFREFLINWIASHNELNYRN